MTETETYTPGPASGAEVQKDGDIWTLIITRELRHSPDKVWRAITEPDHLREWAPYDSDGSLATTGAKVKLTTVGAPQEHITETTVTKAEPPNLLEFNWGDIETRWKLEAKGDGTLMTLWTKIPRQYVSMGAAGWQICFDVLDRLLDGNPIGRMVGMKCMGFEGWKRLNKEYAKQFGLQAPSW